MGWLHGLGERTFDNSSVCSELVGKCGCKLKVLWGSSQLFCRAAQRFLKQKKERPEVPAVPQTGQDCGRKVIRMMVERLQFVAEVAQPEELRRGNEVGVQLALGEKTPALDDGLSSGRRLCCHAGHLDKQG